MSSRSFFQKISVTWSETVGLRTRPQSETKQIGLGLKRRLLVLVLGLAGLVWCCETWSCHARRHNEWSWRTLQLFKYYLWYLYSVFGTSLLWRSTVAFTYLKVNFAKCLYLLPVVLVLSCYFGLRLKNLVLLTSLEDFEVNNLNNLTAACFLTTLCLKKIHVTTSSTITWTVSVRL